MVTESTPLSKSGPQEKMPYWRMLKFNTKYHASGLKKTPSHKPKETDIHLWKQYSKEYRNTRTSVWT
jgi:hypothetical protein